MGAVFALFSAWYFWIPKILGLDYNIMLGIVHFFIMFIGVNVTFFPQHFLGLQGMPRRISDYPDAFAGWNLISSFGSIISVVATWLFLYLLYTQLVQGNATSRYPWLTPQFYSDILQTFLNRAYNSLEWSLISPPKPHAFKSLPLQSHTINNIWISLSSFGFTLNINIRYNINFDWFNRVIIFSSNTNIDTNTNLLPINHTNLLNLSHLSNDNNITQELLHRGHYVINHTPFNDFIHFIISHQHLTAVPLAVGLCYFINGYLNNTFISFCKNLANSLEKSFKSSVNLLYLNLEQSKCYPLDSVSKGLSLLKKGVDSIFDKTRTFFQDITVYMNNNSSNGNSNNENSSSANDNARQLAHITTRIQGLVDDYRTTHGRMLGVAQSVQHLEKHIGPGGYLLNNNIIRPNSMLDFQNRLATIMRVIRASEAQAREIDPSYPEVGLPGMPTRYKG